MAKRENRETASSEVPGIGDAAPDFTLHDLDGKEAHLAALFPLAPLVLIFFRGADSPECVEQLREYKKRNVGLYESGATILAICSDSQAVIRAMVAREKLPFRVLIDENEKVLSAWGLRDATGARTATFVVDKGGSVRFGAMDERSGRMPAARVLEFMRGQNAGQAAS